MNRCRLNSNGNLEIERVVDGNNEFVLQHCIYQNIACGISCPAVIVEEDMVYLLCCNIEMIRSLENKNG